MAPRIPSRCKMGAEHGSWGSITHTGLLVHKPIITGVHPRGADELICDFFAVVEQGCRHEGVAFEFDAEEVELEMENDDDAKALTELREEMRGVARVTGRLCLSLLHRSSRHCRGASSICWL